MRLVFWRVRYRFKDPIKLADRLAKEDQSDRRDGKSHNDKQDMIDDHSTRRCNVFSVRLTDQFQAAMAAKRERSGSLGDVPPFVELGGMSVAG